MMKKWFTIVFFLLVAGMINAKTVASVAGHKIDSRDIDQQVKLINKNSGGKIKDSPALRKEILQRMITRKIAVAEAKRLHLDQNKEYLAAVKTAMDDAVKQGINKKPGFKEDFENYKEALLTDTYALNFLKNNQISDAEARKVYNSMINFYQGSEEVKIGEILTRDERNAKAAVQELKQGRDFSQVAKKYTIDPVLKNNSGIYPEYVNLKDLEAGAPQYYAHVANMKKGQYSAAPLKSPDGFLVIKVVDRRKAQLPAFNTIKNSIKTGIAQSKMGEESERLNQVYKVRIY